MVSSLMKMAHYLHCSFTTVNFFTGSYPELLLFTNTIRSLLASALDFFFNNFLCKMERIGLFAHYEFTK